MKKRVALASVVAVLASLGLSEPAQAAAPVEACWQDVVTHASACFESMAALEASLEAAGNPLVTPPPTDDKATSSHSRLMEAPPLSPDAARASYVLSKVYDGTSSGGASYTFTTPYSSLCSVYFYNIDTMPSGWDNRVSSFQAYGGCKDRVSENTYQGGAAYGPVPYAATLGSMDNQASSMWITG